MVSKGEEERLDAAQRWMGEHHRRLLVLSMVLLVIFVVSLIVQTVQTGTASRTLPVGAFGVAVFLAFMFQTRRLGRLASKRDEPRS